MLKFNRASLLAAALIADVAGFVAAPAFAEEVRTITVGYKDLDVHSQAGQKVLARRVESAARDVCAANGDHSLAMRVAVTSCKDDARAHAKADLQKAGVPAA